MECHQLWRRKRQNRVNSATALTLRSSRQFRKSKLGVWDAVCPELKAINTLPIIYPRVDITIVGKEARSISLWLQLQTQECSSGKTQNSRKPNPQCALLVWLQRSLLLPARLGHIILLALLQRDLQLHTRAVHNMQVHMLCLFHTAKALRIMNLRLRSKVCCRQVFCPT